MPHVTRRQLLAGAGAAAIAALPSVAGAQQSAQKPAQRSTPQAPAARDDRKPPFRYSLNTSTVRVRAKTIVEQIDVAAKAGYDAIEPWIRDLVAHLEQGGTLADVRKRIEDAGLSVAGAIGFASWIVDEEQARAKGLEAARRDMDLVRQIGGVRMAAPPAGATKEPALDLLAAAKRYRALLEVGDQAGVAPMLEVWGFSRNLSRMGESTFVAMESGHPKASLLLDVYHIYKGGSGFGGLRLLNGAAMHVFHVNDYPDDPPREKINDSFRVFPGDGVAPLADILRTLHDTGYRGVLSLELFNRQYWERDPLEVARTGLEKTRAAVEKALG